MSARFFTLGVALALSGCGGAPSAAPAAARATPDGSSAKPPAAVLDPWTVQAGHLNGIEVDAGACVRAKSWEAAEAWAKALRLPKQDAPAKGGETPTAELARLDVGGQSKRAARAYQQTVRYPLAGEVELRHVVLAETEDGRISGCVVSEVVGEEPDAGAAPLRWVAHGERIIELTDEPLADAKGMVELGAAERSSRHLCDVGDALLGCVTLNAQSEVKLVGGGLWYRSRGILLGRSGPFLLSFRPGASALVDRDRANRVRGPRGRAMASGPASRVVVDPPKARVDPAELAPFQDFGPCMTAAVKSAPMPVGEVQGPDQEVSIVDPTPRRWVESFRPEDDSSAVGKRLGLLEGGRPVEAIELSGMSMDDAGAGYFVFVAEPERIAGCVIHLGAPRYRAVADSYLDLSGGRFSFLLERQEGLSLGSARVEEQRFVLCKLMGGRLGCISAPLVWSTDKESLPATVLGDRAEVPPSRAQIDTGDGGFRWTPPSGAAFRLELQPGAVVSVPPPSGPGHPGAPTPVAARATLKSP